MNDLEFIVAIGAATVGLTCTAVAIGRGCLYVASKMGEWKNGGKKYDNKREMISFEVQKRIDKSQKYQ